MEATRTAQGRTEERWEVTRRSRPATRFNGGRARTQLSAILVWTVWAGATLSTISYIGNYARNIPFFDDFTMVPVMTRHEPLSYQWASAQYNEHRNVIPRLVQVGLLRAIPDFRAGLYLNAGLLSAAAAAAIVLARRLRGWTSAVDVVLPLSILTLGQCECLLVGFALNLVMTSTLTWTIIVIIGLSPGRPGWWTCLCMGGSIVLLPLCGGSGMAMLPPLALWLAGYVACGWWSGRDPGLSARAIGLVLLTMTAGVVMWYLNGYVRPPHIPPAPSASAAWSTTLEVCSLVFFPMRWGYWRAAGLAVVVMSVATMFLLGVVAWRTPEQRARAIGLITVLISMLGIAVAVGYSRSGLGPGSGRFGRYITIEMPLLGVVYFAWLIYGKTMSRRLVHVGLLALDLRRPSGAGSVGSCHRQGPPRPVPQDREWPAQRNASIPARGPELSPPAPRPAQDPRVLRDAQASPSRQLPVHVRRGTDRRAWRRDEAQVMGNRTIVADRTDHSGRARV